MANTLSVMTNVLRNVVSKQRIRYKENGFNLDLAYIADNIIAMGYPADKIESIYRNRIEDVYKFLEENHGEHYKIYNLCLERSYDVNKFHGRVSTYPFEDHNPPTIELIQRFCDDVDEWLKANDRNVAAVHCKAGKGRTGTMICCYLLHSRQHTTAESALACYGEKRTKDRKGVTIPSQRRYVQYFSKLIKCGLPYTRRTLKFCGIRFSGANLNQLHSHGVLSCSISVLEQTSNGVSVVPLQNHPIDFRKSLTLDLRGYDLFVSGDIKVEVAPKAKKKLFQFWFNTFFVSDAAIVENQDELSELVYTLNKFEIDDAHKDKDHKCYSEDFKVQLMFLDNVAEHFGDNRNQLNPCSSVSHNNYKTSQNAFYASQQNDQRLLQHTGNNCGGFNLKRERNLFTSTCFTNAGNSSENGGKVVEDCASSIYNLVPMSANMKDITENETNVDREVLTMTSLDYSRLPNLADGTSSNQFDRQNYCQHGNNTSQSLNKMELKNTRASTNHIASQFALSPTKSKYQPSIDPSQQNYSQPSANISHRNESNDNHSSSQLVPNDQMITSNCSTSSCSSASSSSTSSSPASSPSSASAAAIGDNEEDWESANKPFRFVTAIVTETTTTSETAEEVPSTTLLNYPSAMDDDELTTSSTTTTATAVTTTTTTTMDTSMKLSLQPLPTQTTSNIAYDSSKYLYLPNVKEFHHLHPYGSSKHRTVSNGLNNAKKYQNCTHSLSNNTCTNRQNNKQCCCCCCCCSSSEDSCIHAHAGGATAVPCSASLVLLRQQQSNLPHGIINGAKATTVIYKNLKPRPRRETT